jgi:hypothetical protein
MNSRDRFKKTMGYGQPDRVPYFEEGIREDVLTAWREQGMSSEVSLSTLFETDEQEELAPVVEPIPYPTKWPATESELRILRERLDSSDPGRLPSEWIQRVKEWRERDHTLMIRVNRGLFQTLGISDWRRFSEVIYLLKDDPAFVREALDIQSEFVVGMLTRILDEVEVDAAIFSEPIGGNSGPLISPKMYEDLALDSYEPILSTLRDYGVETIIFRTYANSRILIPSILERGFNCLWACEVDTEAMDYRDIRQEYGQDLRLIGGIDLDSLLDSKDAIRREIEDKVPALLAQGGYVPLADGRVRVDVPFERYVYYRQLLQDLILGAAN